MRDPSAPFRIAAARGALDAGAWALVAALAAAGAGGWIAAGWAPATLARVLLAAVSAGAGIAALWYAVRIEIDRRLFAALARTVGDDGAVDDGLAALDRALADLGWIDAAKAGRTLDARVRGAVGLCRAAVLVAIVQWLVVGIAIAVSPIG
ncbi:MULTISPECIES: hypothetical protein [Burkholderia]|jgi:hypothetical protein|uniref:Transmembrane protein n=4 Tax=Burkholderia cenocepacia TaxID=95486 RepID=A0A9Q5R9Q5_9BURK|nr:MULTISPECIES: hypothetical protein [Burkholderia]AIO47356.1 putative membrane protein [Burkholderia cepacia]ALV55286.1 membrane protein [Burkholderia cenocepacia]AMU07243.1 hypothetical protein A2T82_13510 [Burkholderia cenocepacia]AMU15051.1 hypothetical protein A3203_19045 [Burkholderia cenocepacia]AQQ20018.1 hypothetical protein A8D61_16840 [Burkholderia cenocepacia]